VSSPLEHGKKLSICVERCDQKNYCYPLNLFVIQVHRLIDSPVSARLASAGLAFHFQASTSLLGLKASAELCSKFVIDVPKRNIVSLILTEEITMTQTEAQTSQVSTMLKWFDTTKAKLATTSRPDLFVIERAWL
jgi:hypothetical protein